MSKFDNSPDSAEIKGVADYRVEVYSIGFESSF